MTKGAMMKATGRLSSVCPRILAPLYGTMLPPMKSMKTNKKAMTKGAMMKAIATEHGLKQKACTEVINSFVAIATTEVKKTGIFTIPGVCRIKTRHVRTLARTRARTDMPRQTN